MSFELYLAYALFLAMAVFAFIAGSEGRKTRKYIEMHYPDALQRLSPSVAPVGFNKRVSLMFDIWRVHRDVLSDPILSEDRSLVRQVSGLRLSANIVLTLPVVYLAFLLLLIFR